jgi:4-oxalomesaconate tautomerase
VRLEVGGPPERPIVERAGLLRTARMLFDGYAFLRPGALPAEPAAAPHPGDRNA